MKVYSQTEISWIRLDRWTTDSAFFVVRSSWLMGNEFVVCRGRPKGRSVGPLYDSPSTLTGKSYIFRCGRPTWRPYELRTDHALLTVPKSADLSAHVDFHEGKRLVRFAGGKMYGGDAVRFMCIKKGNTWKPDKVWWSNSAQGWAYQMKDYVKTLKKEHIFQIGRAHV